MGLIFSLFLIGIILAAACAELARLNRKTVGFAVPTGTRPAIAPAAPREAPGPIAQPAAIAAAPTPVTRPVAAAPAPASSAEPIETVAAPLPANDEPTMINPADGAEIKKARTRRRPPTTVEDPPTAN